MKNSSEKLKPLQKLTGKRKQNDSKLSPEQKVYEGCKKKHFYDTYYDAVHWAAVSRERAKHSNIYPYKCLYCAGWHIGHARSNGNKFVKAKPLRS
jgi:hypothetical protein